MTATRTPAPEPDSRPPHSTDGSPRADTGAGPVEELTLDGIAHGGEGVGRLADGRAVFVAGAVPGERVRVRVTETRKRFARADLVEVLDPSPDRVEPACPHFGPGKCGGCAWQFLRPRAQSALKGRLVAEQLAHLGKLPDVEVRPVVRPQAPGQPEGYGYRERATLTAGKDGRLGFLRAGSHDVYPVDRCPLLAAPLQDLPAALSPQPPGSKVQVRHGADGDRLVVLDAALDVDVPDLPGVAYAAVAANGKVHDTDGRPWLVERVGGVPLRVGAASFFQVHREGAEALVRLVREALHPRATDRFVDLYAGVGLFAATVGAEAREVISVESWKPATQDAKRNLEGRPGRVVRADALRGLKDVDRADVVVLDPPRAGAGADVIARVVALRPRAVALVSCDPAALARDVRAFVDAGYEADWVQPLDLFPQTPHVEAVTCLRRPRGDQE